MDEMEFRLALHEKLCGVADLLMFHHGPCQMREGGAICLAGDPNPCCVRTRFKRDNPNDKRCYFLGAKGCTFENIECKTWLCEKAKAQAAPDCLEALGALEHIAKLYELTNER